MVQQPSVQDKGKGRAQFVPEQLAPPPTASKAGRPVSPTVSGNIGSSSSSSQGASRTANRQLVGGVQVETRYSGVDTLDEPVSKTIVSWPRFCLNNFSFLAKERQESAHLLILFFFSLAGGNRFEIYSRSIPSSYRSYIPDGLMAVKF